MTDLILAGQTVTLATILALWVPARTRRGRGAPVDQNRLGRNEAINRPHRGAAGAVLQPRNNGGDPLTTSAGCENANSVELES